jgi:glycosyltransferase involved in cell wall biosynthesis
MEKVKKKICWITPDYYLCVDPFIIPYLTDEFDIDWTIINSLNTKRNAEGIISSLIIPKEFNLKYRGKDPRIIFQYINFLFKIRKSEYDLMYISFHGFPYFFPLFLLFINPGKVLWAVHNVRTPKGGSNEKWMDVYQKFIYKRINNFQVFSKYQLSIIEKIIPGKKHYYAPLTLEDYGISKVVPPDNIVRFLFFGYIREYKRLDLLIKSFRELYESGVTNIELLIAGKCEKWEYYDSLIANNEGITKRIDIIPNKDLPDLISSCHYMVLPYKDGAQSAVLTLAYQYNKPVIVSNIESFKQFVIDGTTGFVFKAESQEELTKVMKRVVYEHDSIYPDLKNNVKVFVEKEYAIEKIVDRYRDFLNECMPE